MILHHVIIIHHSNYCLGRWKNGVSLGHDPEGKTLGILGLGGIGKAVAKRMRGFEMKIQYHNRTRQSPEGNPLTTSSRSSTASGILIVILRL